MRMSEINVKKSASFKTSDLMEITGQPWATAQLIVTVTGASVGEYPADDGKQPEPAYNLHMAGIDKPLGCNLTNREMLQSMVGDVEWNTASLSGIRLCLFATSTQMGPGLRLRAVPDTVQAEASAARAKIDTAIARQGLPPREIGGNPVMDAEPPHVMQDADDPGPF
jgi:hypothetical protein